MKRNEKLIRQKLWQYLLPGIMLTAALQIGNIVDTILVGNLLGAEAMSGVKIGMVIDNIMEIPGYVLGVGGSVAVGNLLGRRERDKANRVFSATFFASLILGFCFALLSFSAPALAELLTGGNSLTQHVSQFVFVTLLGAPVLSVALQFINYVAVDNNPNVASAFVICANVVNLTFDYLLLRYTALGTAGAALSTVLGYGLGMLVIVVYLRSEKRMLKFVNPFKGMGEAMLLALSAGLPTLLFMIFETIKDAVLNTMIIRMINNDAMAAYTVCTSVTLIVELLVGGIIGTVSSIGSVVYGEADYFGVRSITKNVTIYGYSVLGILMVLLFAVPRYMVTLFGVPEGPLMDMTASALRIFALSLPFYLLNKLMTTYYQSTEKTMLASLNTSFQTCIAVLPVVLLCVAVARSVGSDLMNALVLGFVFSEILTIAVTLLYCRLKYKGQGFLLLPKESEYPNLDISVDNSKEQTEMIPREIRKFCVENGVGSSKANQIAIAAEEMAVNIITYGGKRANTIDINLCLKDGSILLRLRDNGLPFDPTEYESEPGEFIVHGIELVKKMASQISYTRTLDFNNTVICINM